LVIHARPELKTPTRLIVGTLARFTARKLGVCASKVSKILAVPPKVDAVSYQGCHAHSFAALCVVVAAVQIWLLSYGAAAPEEFLQGYDDTLYARLGVPLNATRKEIRTAFVKLCPIWHPDKRPKDEDRKVANDRFRGIKRAYEILVDPELKVHYDRVQLPKLVKIKPNKLWEKGNCRKEKRKTTNKDEVPSPKISREEGRKIKLQKALKFIQRAHMFDFERRYPNIQVTPAYIAKEFGWIPGYDCPSTGVKVIVAKGV